MCTAGTIEKIQYVLISVRGSIYVVVTTMFIIWRCCIGVAYACTGCLEPLRIAYLVVIHIISEREEEDSPVTKSVNINEIYSATTNHHHTASHRVGLSWRK